MLKMEIQKLQISTPYSTGFLFVWRNCIRTCRSATSPPKFEVTYMQPCADDNDIDYQLAEASTPPSIRTTARKHLSQKHINHPDLPTHPKVPLCTQNLLLSTITHADYSLYPYCPLSLLTSSTYCCCAPSFLVPFSTSSFHALYLYLP